MNDLGEPVTVAAALAAVVPAEGMPETKVDIRHLDFYYGDLHALKDINLGLPDRRITAFIGPSGCGKSTLLRTLNRMYALYPGQRAEGEILLDGINILDSSVDVATLRFQGRHGVPETDAVSHVCIRECRFRTAPVAAHAAC